MEHVTVKFGKDKFDLCVGGRYTVVVGMSGQGKTWLAGVATQCYEVPKYASILGAYKTIGTLSSRHWLDILESDTDIVVIDEDSLMYHDSHTSIPELLATYNHHYIIMSRACLSKIPFGVTDIYDMEYVSEHHVRMVPHKWKLQILRPAQNPDYALLCEDCKSGFLAAKEVYKDTPLQISSACGKDNIISVGFTSGYVAADLCGLGETALKLDTFLAVNPKVQFCDILSFEAECLKAQGCLPELPKDVVSAESFYTWYLTAYLLKKYNLSYKKGNEDIARALVTGYYSHDNKKLQNWKFRDWWVPGVPHTEQK